MKKNLSYLVGTVGAVSILGSVMPQCSASAVGKYAFDTTTEFIKSLFEKNFEDEHSFWDHIVKFFLNCNLRDFTNFIDFFSAMIKDYNVNKDDRECYLLFRLCDDLKNMCAEKRIIGDDQLEGLWKGFKGRRWDYRAMTEDTSYTNVERAWNNVDVFLFEELKKEKNVAQRYKKLQEFIRSFELVSGTYKHYFDDLKGNLILLGKIEDQDKFQIEFEDDELVFTNFFKNSKYANLKFKFIEDEEGEVKKVDVDCDGSHIWYISKNKEDAKFSISPRVFYFIAEIVKKKLENEGKYDLAKKLCEKVGILGKKNETNSKPNVNDDLLNKKTKGDSECNDVNLCSNSKNPKYNDVSGKTANLSGEESLDEQKLEKPVFKSFYPRDKDGFVIPAPVSRIKGNNVSNDSGQDDLGVFFNIECNSFHSGQDSSVNIESRLCLNKKIKRNNSYSDVSLCGSNKVSKCTDFVQIFQM